ncbi:MAG: porphobilinogen deaminase [Dehalococcoidia bacterium]|nr:MAG: porphobilinogen deaminase [Dehalococcoidia bacterium]
MKVRLGTRRSPLAAWQANAVAERLRAQGAVVEMVFVTTAGDRDRHTPLARIDQDGIFTRQLEEALLDGTIDLAVHSLKDLPTTLPPGLVLAATPFRHDPRDALVSRTGLRLATLPAGARVGTSSLRRAAQLRAARPDLRVEPLRGNLDTRLAALRERCDAIVLALAGLLRLGRRDWPVVPLTAAEMLPAAAQGAVGVEARQDDRPHLALVRALDAPQVRRAVETERAFLRRLGGGCRLPAGALAEVAGAQVRLRGAVFSPDGRCAFRGALVGEVVTIGDRLADQLLAAGARDLLAERRP